MVMVNLEMFIMLIILSTMFVRSTTDCISVDGKMKPVNSTWTDDKGCSCTCIELNELIFEQCENCNKNPIEKISSVSNEKICQYNGYNYSVNDLWMSSEINCAQCSCQSNGQTSCVSDKHCRNTCQHLQIPKYGPCCEILQCSENGPTFQEDIKCWDSFNNVNVSHGKSSIRKERCIDKFCICFNGHWMCHNYCKLTYNDPFRYWNKLCCPRRLGSRSCIFNKTIIQPGEKAFIHDVMDNCTCLSEILYCDKNGTLNSEINHHITTAPISSESLIMLIALLSLSGFILTCFILIVICSNLDKYKQKILRKEKPADNILLNDYQDNYSNIQGSSTNRI